MTEINTHPDIAEVAPLSPTSHLELFRYPVLAKAAALAGGLALIACNAAGAQTRGQSSSESVANALQSEPLPYAGVTTNKIWVPRIKNAREAARLIMHITSGSDAAQINAVHISKSYVQDRVGISDELSDCNAETVAEENGLTLFQTILFYNNHGRLGFYPQNADVRKFATSMKETIETEYGPGGCAQDVKKVFYIFGNEIDSSFFNRIVRGRNSSNTLHKKSIELAAQKDIRMLSVLKPIIDATENKINDEFRAENPYKYEPLDISVVAGSVTAKGGNEFNQARAKAMEKLKIKYLPADALAFHPWPNSPTSPPSESGIADYPDWIKTQEKAFGRTYRSIADEWGYGSDDLEAKDASQSKNNKVSKPDTDPQSPTSGEELQGEYVAQGFRMQGCQTDDKLEASFTFLLTDERDQKSKSKKPKKVWHTGLYHFDKTPKASLAPVGDAMSDALSGNVDCSTITKK